MPEPKFEHFDVPVKIHVRRQVTQDILDSVAGTRDVVARVVVGMEDASDSYFATELSLFGEAEDITTQVDEAMDRSPEEAAYEVAGHNFNGDVEEARDELQEFIGKQKIRARVGSFVCGVLTAISLSQSAHNFIENHPTAGTNYLLGGIFGGVLVGSHMWMDSMGNSIDMQSFGRRTRALQEAAVRQSVFGVIRHKLIDRQATSETDVHADAIQS